MKRLFVVWELDLNSAAVIATRHFHVTLPEVGNVSVFNELLEIFSGVFVLIFEDVLGHVSGHA